MGHTDAVWDFKLSPSDRHLLASASADKSVKIWDTESEENLLKSSLTLDQGKHIYQSIDANVLFSYAYES